jgi:hypothetical protein
MLRRVLAAFAVFLAVNAQAPAQSVVIDNFNEGTFNITATSGTPSVSQLDQGLSNSNTLGTRRISRAHFISGGGGGDQVNVNNTANPGRFSTNLTATATGHFHLYYGYTAYDPASSDPVSPLHTFADINADIAGGLPGGNIGVALDFTTLDHNATLILKLVTNHTGGGQTVSVVSKPVTANLSPFVVQFTNAELTAGIVSGPGLNFADVDQVILEVGDLEGGTDLVLDSLRFTSVPEPTTWALIGCTGLLAVGGTWYRRRRAGKADLVVAAE